MEREQCPQRGPGLSHTFDDGLTCDTCGVAKRAPTVAELWARMLQAGRHPVTPTVIKVSGEPQEQAPDLERLGDFAALTTEQWHRAVVVRSFYEKHRDRWG